MRRLEPDPSLRMQRTFFPNPACIRGAITGKHRLRLQLSVTPAQLSALTLCRIKLCCHLAETPSELHWQVIFPKVNISKKIRDDFNAFVVSSEAAVEATNVHEILGSTEVLTFSGWFRHEPHLL